LKADQTEPERVLGLKDNLFPGWMSNYGLEGISGADALLNPYFRELLAGLGINQIWNWRTYLQPADVAAVKPAMDFLNVRHYVDLRSDEQLLGAILSPVSRGDLDVYRSETTWPRAFFSSTVVPYATIDELAQKIRRGDGPPFAAVQQRDLAALPELAGLTSPSGVSTLTKATDYRLTTNSTRFSIEVPGPGVAVLHEAFLKDAFNVTVNGKPVSYFRLNHAFKGVFIPAAGSYQIRFAYWPESGWR
jgi:hypothetical protein